MVVQAIATHHDATPRTFLGTLSKARPSTGPVRGASCPTVAVDTYIKRLNDLEGNAQSFAGVQQAFAVQAGREIRDIVDAMQVTDDAAFLLSNDIAWHTVFKES